MKSLRRAVKAIRAAKTVVISGHVNPDGDSLGSLLSLGLGLRAQGKRVWLLSADRVPEQYRALPGARTLVRTLDRRVDLAIAVDCSTFEVLGTVGPAFERARTILEIDHHEFRSPFGDIRLVDPRAGSVGEIVFQILQALRVPLTRPIAVNILTSIIVETNLFSQKNIQPATFDLCARLIRTGIDFSSLVHRVYGPRTRKGALLSAHCLSRCQFLAGGRLIWGMVRARDFRKFKAKDSDVDALPNEMCAIDGVRVAMLFRQKERGMLRVSLRSRNGVNVGKLAERCGGGGHADIAGCMIPDQKQAVARLVRAACEMIRQR